LPYTLCLTPIAKPDGAATRCASGAEEFKDDADEATGGKAEEENKEDEEAGGGGGGIEVVDRLREAGGVKEASTSLSDASKTGGSAEAVSDVVVNAEAVEKDEEVVNGC
jgi:hypothetical protein